MEKRWEKIKLFFYVITLVGIMLRMLWLGNTLMALVDRTSEQVKFCYYNLDYGVQEIIRKLIN